MIFLQRRLCPGGKLGQHHEQQVHSLFAVEKDLLTPGCGSGGQVGGNGDKSDFSAT